VIEIVDLVSESEEDGEVSKGAADMSLDSDKDHDEGTMPAPYEPQSPIMPNSPQSWPTANAHRESRASTNVHLAPAPGAPPARICRIVPDQFILPMCDPDILNEMLCAVEDARKRFDVDCSLILHTSVYEEIFIQMLVTVDGIIWYMYTAYGIWGNDVGFTVYK
jgi:hypothetical protein